MNSTPLTTRFPADGPSSLGDVSPELASLSEIAALLSVTKRTAQRYAERGDFPHPVDTLATGRIWRRADVEAWGKASLPLRTGRPPKTDT